MSSNQVEQVKNAIDIVALIGERVKLTRAGKNYKGLCPFHSEKSPSFFVTPELGRYKCFGCQESGDCFTFLEKMDGLSFGQSLQELAKRAGITLVDAPFTQEDKQRERLLALLSLAKEYYHYLLTTHPIGESARQYINERGVRPSTLELFGIGFAPPAWDGIQKFLIGKKHFTETELLDAGLIIRNDRGRIYDRFRGRLMFPLTTPRGQIVGFSGRLLDKNAKEAKYINSPETSLYHKSELLFGYSQLSSFIRRAEEVVVCEGEFDAISSLQAGVENVVAIKGSALTQPQIKFLAHAVKRIILALDADSAGIEATKRAIALLGESGLDLNLRVLPLIGGKDPDEIARQDPKVWREMATKSVSVYEYLIDVAFGQFDPTTGDGKREISKSLAPLLASIANAVERAHYTSTVAKRLGVSEDVFAEELRKVKLPVNQTPAEKKTVSQGPKTRRDIVERYVLLLLLAAFSREHEQARMWIEETAKQVDFSMQWEKIFAALYAQRFGFDIAAVVAATPDELKETVSALYIEANELAPTFISQAELEKTWHEHVGLSAKASLKAKIARMSILESLATRSTEEEVELEKLRRTLVS